MRDNNSRYKVRLKGRSPKGGYKAYNGGSDGSVRLSEATQIAIYLTAGALQISLGGDEE